MDENHNLQSIFRQIAKNISGEKTESKRKIEGKQILKDKQVDNDDQGINCKNCYITHIIAWAH